MGLQGERRVLYCWPRTSSLATQLGQRYKVKGNACWKSSNIIYLIECKICGHQYIGETGQPLHCRFNDPRFDIAHLRTDESPMAVHFNNMAQSVEDMAVM